ncbi:MAG: Gfo/Idh/MocA family oxidoreductase [Verrucomicrobia bacterium]|jgi:predicted dehydrogenase|nr:Gfo/Idh/MocA family oxidoreductase [Verrucomicrobiota bacterium]OQC26556.1 MAG: putative oxidoreductase YdgJ [Verrucomicrobia bacterium ADurb.Bin063]MBP8015506.1 Gfo/Idh/MocA family oxidoreductase [Verrucomicrobiota bacterium]MDI9373246.1 Gfo/Idh/MocA family oxidoreductase [Verrucomicrobiota bacterium]HNW08563.1 Gfo/Idh/MocA family oxidoreductase [Verrucomicrobiota bacterium]
MKQTIKVGVAGCGYWGPNLIRNLRQSPDCQLKLLCDPSEQRLAHMRRLYPEVATTRQFDDLLNGADLDALVIATPVRYHYEMAMAGLRAGKHVFVEKPMARTEAEAEEMAALAEREGLVLMVGHTFLFSPAVRRMKEIVDAGDIGEVQYIAARRLNLGLFQKDINVAWDLAPHDISILLHLLEEHPVSVSCQGSCHVTRSIEDVTMMYLTFARNRCAMIHNSWLDPKKVRQMTVVGSQRMIVYDDTEPLEKLKIYDARVEVPPHYDTFAEFTYSYHYGDAYVPYIKQDEPLKLECQHFLECIRAKCTPIAGGRLGLEVVRILEAASESLRQQGAPVSLEAVTQWNNGHDGNGKGSESSGRVAASPARRILAA